MATVKCPLGNRGTPSHEWHDGEKSRIYCQGWIDSMTDELLGACRNCPDHVDKAQDDLDKWNAEHRNNQQVAVQKRLIYAEDLFEPVDVNVLMVSVGGRSGGKTMAMYEALFRKRVEMAPTIDAVPVVHGYWFLTEHEYLNCSVCGKPYYTGIETLSAALDHLEYAGGHKFCPNCGAKMDLKGE